MRSTIIGAILAMTATGAQAAEKFDLNCLGTATWTVGREAKPQPLDNHGRIDLTHKTSCWDDCTGVTPITSFNDQEIVFDVSSMNVGNARAVSWRVNRVTGEETMQMVSNVGLNVTIREICTPSAFTGIPKPKSKF